MLLQERGRRMPGAHVGMVDEPAEEAEVGRRARDTRVARSARERSSNASSRVSPWAISLAISGS